MYHLLLQRVIFPFMESFKGTRIQKDLEFLRDSQWWTPQELEEFQRKRLRSLVKHAYSNVPYYRRIFRERGFTHEDIRTFGDLERLPFLTKAEIRHHLPDLLATNYRQFQPLANSTSGSTGEPLRYYTSLPSISMLWASGFRAWEWAGYRLGDRYATLGGSSLVPSHIPPEKRLRYLAERNLPLTSFQMKADTLGRYVSRLSRFRPLYLRGYPSSLFILARYIREHGSDGITPRAIFTTAEALLPSQRRYIEEVFRCQVFDQYGCRDGGVDAMECTEHHGYHANSEQSFIELIRDDAPVEAGELGEIASTDLCNYVMPFIRYRTGDTAIRADERCPCGRGLPLLRSVQGRIINLVLHEDGSLVPGLPLTDVFEHIALKSDDSIRQYQLIQEEPGQMTVKIVRGANYSDEHSEEIISEIRDHMGRNTRVRLDFVDEIPPEKHGKNLFVISKIASGF